MAYVRNKYFEKGNNKTNIHLFSVAPNEGRNNWCHFELRDFDLETFRDFFILRDQKTSGAKARWHSLEGRPCEYENNPQNIAIS